MKKLILASSSPRRRQLLSDIGLEFEVIVSDVDENSIEGIDAQMFVQELSLLKANAVAAKARDMRINDALIISADTVVCLDGEILGKPVDRDDAFRILRLLSGRMHEVYTGICVMRTEDGFAATSVRKTSVCFKSLSDEKIRSYIQTGEPMDKAGAYGIQGYGATLVKEIHGDYFNVVGLPIEALSELLETEFEFRIF
ncbi:MAG: Maf family protein [Clostridia bacterium]|nr:Maf family protein [Clostridia bacterium]